MPDSSNKKEITPYRDEATWRADMEKAFKETINEAISIFKLIKRRPDIWCKTKMQELHALAYKVADNPIYIH